ncbi:S-transferase [Shewanella mangrovi]|uniref:S-transferase n=1 Tax=Shewanella mangrovi TaxID=1515746 RepID=A0A094J9A4_9GAMM|nr:glutathione-dependent disulfide-bond oxidoreductase [Shewanella mangrovi]KFZ36490.1 S-transferase [Shewanella mangrovi]
MAAIYIPPQVWSALVEEKHQEIAGNRPTAGARYDESLPVGNHKLQLYSLATPNGQKVAIMLEELLALGVREAEYDAFLIKIGKGEQFSSGFVDVNPNSKIPALVDYSHAEPIKVFESGNILLYLADKFGQLLPRDHAKRTEVLNWLFWLQGSAPYLGGGFGHFYVFAIQKFEYPINRFAMEVKRQLDVLNRQLANRTFIAGDEYSIADIAIWPWYGNLVLGHLYDAAEFLDVQSYQHVQRWARLIAERPAVKRGRIVNRLMGAEWERLAERHCAADIDAVLAKAPK